MTRVANAVSLTAPAHSSSSAELDVPTSRRATGRRSMGESELRALQQQLSSPTATPAPASPTGSAGGDGIIFAEFLEVRAAAVVRGVARCGAHGAAPRAQAVVALAVFRLPDPFIPLHSRVRNFVDDLGQGLVPTVGVVLKRALASG